MALGTPSESPAVVVKEVDLTGGVPNVQSTTGAFVGNFSWGPQTTTRKISNEAELVDVYGAPSESNNIDFISASYFLRYSNSLEISRAATDAAKNARSTHGQTAADSDSTLATVNVGNEFAFDPAFAALDSNNQTFIGRYKGSLGNSIRVSICPYSTSDTLFDDWAYKSSFDAAPGTSTFATNKAASFDEVHVAVVDQGGLITGTRGTVLETYPFVSVGSNAQNTDGTNNFIKDVLNERSSYVFMVNFDSDFQSAGAGTTIDSGDNFTVSNLTQTKLNYDFAGGVNSGTLGTSQILSGFDKFEDKDIIEVDFLIAPSMTTTADQTTVVNDLVSTAQTLRKDCVVVTSPARDDVVNLTSAATITSNITTTAATFTKSSYLIVDGNFLKVYDKYNDKYIQIPAASSTAGLMAATDRNTAPWFSPAGARRGQYLGVTSIPYSPTKAQRDTLYKAGVNPIANIPGAGLILFGDKTNLGRPSAFDRINVRRLFLVLERAISRAAESVLFEFNDEFTRAEFVNIVEPVLREVKGRRGITDFRVVCDETNNTAAVIDRNEFIASIFIKPARSINFVTLNFVAVRTGVDFEEVVGTV